MTPWIKLHSTKSQKGNKEKYCHAISSLRLEWFMGVGRSYVSKAYILMMFKSKAWLLPIKPSSMSWS
jgi:hypothetical protein